MANRTPAGYKWNCNLPSCMAERDEYGDDEEGELFHCNGPECHVTVWTEKGVSCEVCGLWFCAFCWQHEKGVKSVKGFFDLEFYCDEHFIKSE